MSEDKNQAAETEALLQNNTSINYWHLALVVFVLSVPLRLYFFAGVGLGDDLNEIAAVVAYQGHGGFNPADFAHYRFINILARHFSFLLFGHNEAAFVLPIILFSFGTYLVSLFFARSLFGSRAAFIVSLLFFATPYETLCTTANIPDYLHAFFSLLGSYLVWLAYKKDSRSLMLLAALVFFGGILSRLYTILPLLTLGLITISSLKKLKLWSYFWSGFFVLLLGLCLFDYQYSGRPLNWFFFNSGGGGVMVDHILGFVLAVYPRYLLYLDDFDNWMFGFSGWLAVVGALCCLWRVLRRKAVTSDYALFFALFVFVALFEFMPSQLTFKHYYSHSRIFRYMVFISPVIYLSGAYFLNILLNTNRRLMRALAWGLLIAVSAFGLYQTPKVSYPLCNANKDMRELAAYIRENPFPEKAKIYTDYWRIAQVSSRLHPLTSARNWSYYGVAELSSEKRVEFLNAAADGYLITGGASLPWYSGIDLIISLQRLNFSAPSSWHLLKEIPGSKESWRVEPLRLWKVENP